MTKFDALLVALTVLAGGLALGTQPTGDHIALPGVGGSSVTVASLAVRGSEVAADRAVWVANNPPPTDGDIWKVFGWSVQAIAPAANEAGNMAAPIVVDGVVSGAGWVEYGADVLTCVLSCPSVQQNGSTVEQTDRHDPVLTGVKWRLENGKVPAFHVVNTSYGNSRATAISRTAVEYWWSGMTDIVCCVGSGSFGNGRNEIHFRNSWPSGFGCSQHYDGCIRYFVTDKRVTEADIVVRTDRMVTHTRGDCRFNPHPNNSHSILAHEFGHAFGLGVPVGGGTAVHSNNAESIMQSPMDRCFADNQTGSYDWNLLCSLYHCGVVRFF